MASQLPNNARYGRLRSRMLVQLSCSHRCPLSGRFRALPVFDEKPS
ncbi:hypothetical protein V3C99_017767 [Haemonchus contortus]